MRSSRRGMPLKFSRAIHLRTAIMSALTAFFAIEPSVALADVEFWFFPLNGGTQVSVTGSGINNEFGGVASHVFSDLIGGNPFDDTLADAAFPIGPIAMNAARNLNEILPDSDGRGQVGADDFTIGFRWILSDER